MEDADRAVKQSGIANLGPGNSEDVTNEHVLEVLRLTGSFAHQKNGGSRSDGVGDANESLLGDVAAGAAGEREDGGTEEREGKTDPVRSAAMRVHAADDGDRGAKRRDLGQSKVDENDTALDDVHAQIGVYS